MANLEAEARWAEENQAAYRPSQEVKDALAEITLALIVGPTSIGKSHIIRKVIEKDSAFAAASSITTRPARPDDPENYQTGVPKEEILRRIKERSLVQYAVHPASKEIYASDAASFPAQFVLLPTLASSVRDFEDLGFKKIIPIGLLADSHEWEARLKTRVSDKDFTKRLHEAKDSVEWIQVQSGEIAVLENKTGEDAATAAQIIQLMKGQLSETLSARQVNQLSLGIIAVINARLRENGE